MWDNIHNAFTNEYSKVVLQTDGSLTVQIITSLIMLAIGLGLSFSSNKKILSFLRTRHISFFLTNVIYIIGVICQITSLGAMFWLGGISSEAVSQIVQMKSIKKIFFIFSSIFMYSFYLFLRLSFSIENCLFLSIICALSTSIVFTKYSLAFRESELFASSILIPLGIFGIIQGGIEDKKGLYYIETFPVFLFPFFFFLLFFLHISRCTDKII